MHPDDGPPLSRNDNAPARRLPPRLTELHEMLGPGQRQFIKFLLVGVLNTVVGYGFFVLFTLLKLGPTVALGLSYILGVLFNYMSTGKLVFAARGLGRLPYFVAVYGLTFLLNLWSLHFLVSMGIHQILAQAMLLPLTAIFSFTLNKIFVFRIARPS